MHPRTLPEVEALVRARLAEPLPGADAQRKFAPRPARPGWSPHLTPETARRAAALILIYPREHGDLCLALTRRRDDLPHHPGQISLPGGAIDPGESPVDAALRETQEEIGVAPDTIRLVGALSSFWVVVSNFLLYPFVGVTDARPDFKPAEAEVAAIVELPLGDLLDPGKRGWHPQSIPHESVSNQMWFPYMKTGENRIWGATAMVLSEFAHLFDKEFAPPEPPM